MLNLLAYAACLWLLTRTCGRETRAIADILAANWAIGIAVWSITESVNLPIAAAIDFATALALIHPAKTARRVLAGLMQAPLFAVDIAAMFAVAVPDNFINAAAWAQMAVVLLGAWGDGLGQAARDLSARVAYPFRRRASARFDYHHRVTEASRVKQEPEA